MQRTIIADDRHRHWDVPASLASALSGRFMAVPVVATTVALADIASAGTERPGKARFFSQTSLRSPVRAIRFSLQ